ncbi:energy transducer TonB [Salegentibacter sp. Hel_I_6]|uniref:energy transducer TonB family protein n=1 Tax=Salegentibacter sp. Hel_I_6 TaxID=1250278 RepID=UPI00068B9695|nr:energy transducer TonB [Salegentibacter sp. Hel_I_6]
MKKLYLSLIFTVISFSAFAQDTIYMDNKYQELDNKKNAEYFKIITPTPDEDYEFLRTLHYLDGQIKSKETYDLENDKEINEGEHTYWYDTGELFYNIDFKNGKKHGDLIAYWKNGNKRRHDVFKRDQFKNGKVWNQDGKEIEHFNYFIRPEFPGGLATLSKYIKLNIQMPSEHNSTHRVVVNFTVDTDGSIIDIKIKEDAPSKYTAEAYRVIKEMPKWKPAKRFGEIIKISYSLPLVFQK